MRTLRQVLEENNFVVMDTETTGLERGSEIIQIAIIDDQFHTLLDALVKPTKGIPQAAFEVHGIPFELATAGASWGSVRQAVFDIIHNRDVIIYNAAYDVSMLISSDQLKNYVPIDWAIKARWFCAMKAYAEFWGEWNERRQSYTWQKLSAAANRFAIEMDVAHSALDDCKTTLAVCQELLKRPSFQPPEVSARARNAPE